MVQVWCRGGLAHTFFPVEADSAYLQRPHYLALFDAATFARLPHHMQHYTIEADYPFYTPSTTSQRTVHWAPCATLAGMAMNTKHGTKCLCIQNAERNSTCESRGCRRTRLRSRPPCVAWRHTRRSGATRARCWVGYTSVPIRCVAQPQ